MSGFSASGGGGDSGTGRPSLFLSWSCIFLRRWAICSAITRRRSCAVIHLGHRQSLYSQYLLCPFSGVFTLWFLQRTQFGLVRGLPPLTANTVLVDFSLPDSSAIWLSAARRRMYKEKCSCSPTLCKAHQTQCTARCASRGHS